MSMEKQTLDGLQVLRGIAALIVLAFHAALIEKGHDYTLRFSRLNPFVFFGYGGVNLFFVLSGFIIVWINRENLGRPAEALRYLSSRIVRIFPIFWLVWLASAFVQVTLLRDAVNAEGDVIPTAIRALLLVDPQAHFLVPQAWTLNYEVLFYALFVVFFFLPRAALVPAVVMWGVAIAITDLTRATSAMALNLMCLHFVGGMLIAVILRKGWVFAPRTCVLVGMAWWIVSAFLNWRGWMSTEDIRHRFYQFGVSSFLIVYGIAALDLTARPAYPRLLIRLGDASYALYLNHLALLFLCSRIGQGIRTTPQYASWLIGMLVVPVLLALWLHTAVERPLMSLFQKIKPLGWRAGALTGLGVVTLMLGTLCMDRASQLFMPRYRYEATLRVVEGRTLLTLNGKDLSLLAERQGWAKLAPSNGAQRLVYGWALDRAADATVQDVLIFIDGALLQVVTPVENVDALKKAKQIAGRRPGFKVSLNREHFTPDRALRFIAVTRQGEAGELYYGIEGREDLPSDAIRFPTP